jgi:hypothetical protein
MINKITLMHLESIIQFSSGASAQLGSDAPAGRLIFNSFVMCYEMTCVQSVSPASEVLNLLDLLVQKYKY